MKRGILFISSSVGLGHAARDLAIAKELRKRNSDINIEWLAGDPAGRIIQEAGEVLLPESNRFGQESTCAEKSANSYQLNLMKYSIRALLEWRKSAHVVQEVTTKKKYDLIIADEAYELLIAFLLFPWMKKAPLIMIYDFLGLDAATKNPLEKLAAYIWNVIWIIANITPWLEDLSLFVGNEDDVADKPFGLFLPNRRMHALKHYKFLGNILPFNPLDYMNKDEIKQRLGYGPEPLVLCAVGGTAIGKELLSLCSRAYAIVKDKVPTLRMVLVCGPRIDPNSVLVTDGVEIRGFVPKLYEHFAACDLAIVQGGGTTTMELVSLHKNFLYFPLEGHVEQMLVAEKLNKIGAGTKMNFSATSDCTLAEAIVKNLQTAASFPCITVDGEVKAAGFIQSFL